MIITALLLALAAPSTAQTVRFEAAEAEIIHALPGYDELAARIRSGTREERMAAITRASGMYGGFDLMGQRVVLEALRDQAESLSAPGEVRGRAYVVIGEQFAWMKDDDTKRIAAGILLDALEASPGDSREGYRRHAVKGLRAAVGRLPQDEMLENRAAKALTACVQSSDSFERTLALHGLDDLLGSRPRVASMNRAGPALRDAVLEPIARSPQSFCVDGRRDGDERWASIKVLAALSWASEDAALRQRVRTVMSEIAVSDSNPMIRRQADRWSRSARA